MGVKMYYIMVALVLVFGILMPQKGPERKRYIILMFLCHTFVCAFRYQFMHGDLLKYEFAYSHLTSADWTLSAIWSDGRNSLFFLLRNIFSLVSGKKFQYFLIFIAIVIELILAIFIYRYSPAPWFSYLIWNCLSFYIFGFSAIKQALAMSFVMWAAMEIFEKHPKRFLLAVFLAGMIHGPAFCFLPAYWLAYRKINGYTFLLSLVVIVLVYTFRTTIVNFIRPLYYDEEGRFYLQEVGLGTRFLFIAGLVVLGFYIRDFQSAYYQACFHFMLVATIFQIFSSFDNIFTRLTDYYFQFSILYIPMLFYDPRAAAQDNKNARSPLLPLHPRLNSIAIFVAAGMVMLYYYATQLSAHIAYAVDDYLNFRFMWDV